MRGKSGIWGGVFALALLGFTAYVLLDTFVITRVYTPVYAYSTEAAGQSLNNTEVVGLVSSSGDTAYDALAATETASGTATEGGDAAAAVVTENSYQDENISILITEYRQNNTSIYVADVQLASAAYLKTALAQGAYGKNVTDTTSSILSGVNGILGINGDFYGARESGYVLRNGVLYRDTAVGGREDLVIYQDGSMEIIQEGQIAAQDLLAQGAQQILSFGPALVQEGQIAVTQDEEVGKAMASNPRTAMGWIDDLHFVLVVSDGRTSESEGLTLYQLAEFMQSLGVKTAYNLDGGGSSTMVFMGELVNNPTTNGRSIRERSVSDIVYIGY